MGGVVAGGAVVVAGTTRVVAGGVVVTGLELVTGPERRLVEGRTVGSAVGGADDGRPSGSVDRRSAGVAPSRPSEGSSAAVQANSETAQTVISAATHRGFRCAHTL